MIEEIQIKDLGVIQDATLQFGKGLTVLTGETGAGKTMVLTALGLLLGDRSDSSAIRSGCTQTSVSGVWNLPSDHKSLNTASDAGALTDDGVLLLSRTVSADGRSKAIAGGRQVPVGILTELGQELVVVHGQADQIRLKSAQAQRNALDSFAGNEHEQLLDQYSSAFNQLRTSQEKLAQYQASLINKEKELFELNQALDFLNKLDPKPNEDVELQELAARLTHTEQLRSAVSSAHEALIAESYEADDALGLIGKARKMLDSAAGFDSSLVKHSDALTQVIEQLNDVAAELSSYLSSIESESGLSLDQIQERRSEISIAIRRYGPTLDDVINLRTQAEQRMLLLEGGSQSLDKLEQEVAQDLKSATLLAEKVSESRNQAAIRLSTLVTAELKSLAMAGSALEVKVDSGAELGPNGFDSVTFLLQSYEGAEPRPVAKAASGGELSRIMLAIEVILAQRQSATTFVFDEVDAGVGGAAAIEVGKRLKALAGQAQVIVVTHLAQVAAFADKHLTVVKTSAAGFTASDVKDLDVDQRKEELARMLSGLKESDSALEHANELLDLAKIF